MAKVDNRFIVTYKQGGGFSGPAVKILVDKKTGVNYIWSESGYAGGLTVLLDREGKPVITPVSNEYKE